MATKEKQNTGRIVEIKGVVLDAVFPGDLPEINYALSIQVPGGVSDLTVSQSSLGQMADMGGDNGDSANLKFDNLWITGSPMMGFDFYVQNPNSVP